MTVDALERRRRPTAADAPPPHQGLRLLDAVPAMAEAVPPHERELAGRVVLPIRESPAGVLMLPAPTEPGSPFAVVIVEGTVLRETHLGDRMVGELLGPGDLLGTHPDDDDSSLPSWTDHLAREPVTLALLDDRFLVAARRWPGLHQVVAAQQARQVRRASRHLAALGLPRVEDRVMALFCDLADRWGRVTPEGIRIDVPLTHALIGQLVGARRPTVSLALTDLAAAGSLVRHAERCWLLDADVPLAA